MTLFYPILPPKICSQGSVPTPRHPNVVYFDRSELDFSDVTRHHNSKFPIQSKVMMKKRLKITEIATLPESV